MKTSKKRGFTNASEPKLCVAQHLSDCVKAESCSDIAKLLIGVGPAADRRALLVSNLQNCDHARPGLAGGVHRRFVLVGMKSS